MELAMIVFIYVCSAAVLAVVTTMAIFIVRDIFGRRRL